MLFYGRDIYDLFLNDFNEHLEFKINEYFKIKSFLKRLSNKLPRQGSSLNPDYGDIVYDKSSNKRFIRKEYKACLTITRTAQGTYRERLNKENCLESLSHKR